MKIKIYLIGFYIILFLPLLVLPPWFYPPDWGKTIIFRSLVSLLSFLFLWQFLFERKELLLPDIKHNKIVWALTALFIIVSIATLFSADINFSLWGSPYRAAGAVNFLFYIIFAILAFLVIKKSDWDKLINLSFAVGILVCLLAFIQFYGLFNHIFISVSGRPPSTMGNPIMLAIYLVLLLFLVISFALKENKRGLKIFYAVSALIFLWVILITGSRAAYLGVLVGGLYFILSFPKKMPRIKIATAILLLLAVFGAYYLNTSPKLPQFLANNRFFGAVQSRLSLNSVLADPRFSAWQVVFKVVKEKPIFGWGPENLAIGFDKYYNPSLPYISKAWGGWWDRAHNIFLDISATTGIPSLLAYLALFITLFWQLQKLKYQHKSEEISINQWQAHGMQATLIAYLVANIFSFDAFASYLIFFLLIGYSLFLINQNQYEPAI